MWRAKKTFNHCCHTSSLTTQPGTAASSVRLKAGTAVEARWNGGSYWSGKVTKANSNGTYDITWDSDGTMQKNTPLGDLKLK